MSSLSRRGFLTGLSVTAGGAALVACSGGDSSPPGASAADGGPAGVDTRLQDAIVPFDGVHQAGVSTPGQAQLNLIGFTLAEGVDRGGVARLMRSWTEDSRRLCTGETPLGSLEPELVAAPSNLTVTCGFGPRIFDVIDAPEKRPEWLRPLPEYSLDQLDPKWGQTDLVLQVCCDDPLMLSHATRHLVRSGADYAGVQWMQQGFLTADGARAKDETPRNLFGQVDGTVNPRSEEAFDEQVWIDDGPAWMQGSTSMVLRRINMKMDTWERLDRKSREESMGRRLDNGAPLTGEKEFDDPDYDATDKYGLPIIDRQSHMFRAKAPEDHPEQKFLRRPYNYDIAPEPGSSQLSNSGLVFLAFQKDPVRQYDPVQQRLNDADRLNEWITHIGSAVYWVPPGTSADGRGRDGFWAQSLLDDA